MKLLLAASFGLWLAVGLAAAAPVPATDKFSDFIEELWWQGNEARDAAYALANARQQANPTDLASMLVCLDYASGFMDTNKISALLPRIRAASARISTPYAREQKPTIDETVKTLSDLLPTVTPEMSRAEAYKGRLPEKPLESLGFVQALEADGLVPPVTSAERARVEASLSSTPVLPPKTAAPAPASSSAPGGAVHDAAAADRSSRAASDIGKIWAWSRPWGWVAAAVGALIAIAAMAWRSRK